MKTFHFYFLIFLLSFICTTSEGRGYSIRIEDVLPTSFTRTITCVTCNAGAFSGTFSVDGKPLNCSQYCPLGSCPIGINCTLCASGTYNTKPNCTECISCGEGKVSPPGSQNCTTCEAGFSNNTDSSSCVSCKPGTYSEREASICQPCPQGQFSNSSASTRCFDCQAGSYNSLTGQPVCSACGVGKYNPAVRSTSAGACLICPGGYFCPYFMTAAPEACPENSYCPTGSAGPSSCSFLFQSDKASESCQPKAALYLLMLAGVATLVVIISVIVCIRTSNKNKPGPESKQPTEADRLIPEPRDGPVYEGL